MKAVIIYKGNYDATRQYASWLAAALKIPVLPTHNQVKEDHIDCDYIIIGSSVYMGVPVIKEWLMQNASSLAGKKIFLFIVCGTALTEKAQLEQYIQSSVPGAIQFQCIIHFLPGNFNYKNLRRADKFMLRIRGIFSGPSSHHMKLLADYDLVRMENLLPLPDNIVLFEKSRVLNAVA